MAARLGDAHGDEALALKTLENGIARFPEAAAMERAKVNLYRAELAVWTGDRELAQASLTAARSLELTDENEAALADEFAHVTELVRQEQESLPDETKSSQSDSQWRSAPDLFCR